VGAVNEIKLKKVRIIPKNIFLMQDKTLKLINPFLDYSEDLNRDTLQRPHRLMGQINTSYEKKIVFEVGMTMLSVITLENCL
jgi:hypothetical protein